MLSNFECQGVEVAVAVLLQGTMEDSTMVARAHIEIIFIKSVLSVCLKEKRGEIVRKSGFRIRVESHLHESYSVVLYVPPVVG